MITDPGFTSRDQELREIGVQFERSRVYLFGNIKKIGTIISLREIEV